MTDTPQQVAERILASVPPNYPLMFRERVAASPEKIAYTVPDGQGWRDVPWREIREAVDEVAAGLVALGLRPEQRVAIASATRLEWILADLGIACAAGATTTIYPNTHAEDEAHILIDSGSAMAVVENNAQLTKLQGIPEMLGQLSHIIVFDDDRPADAPADGRVVTWQGLRDLGREHLAANPSCLDDAIAGIRPDSLATLIYTSGTTGRPKGVELAHRSWTYEGAAMRYSRFVDADDVIYLWLPLAHVYGRCIVACQLAIGMRAVLDGRIDRIVQGLGETHPTVFIGVPRIFEKVRAAVMTMYPQNGFKGRVSRWAFKIGRDSRPYRLAGKPLPRLLAVQYAVADRLVFSKLKTRLGGRMRFMISGSAKLSRQVQQWFYSAGITIIEGYGSTETAAITFLNLPDEPRFGTVGPVIPGLDTRLADDGEVLVKGPPIARGYHNLPEDSAEAFEDGWFHTGDIGVFDPDGFLTITDRKNDLFKTSNGKFVAPQKVENAVMANIPYVSQVVAIGNDRKYVTALVALDPAALQKWAERRDRAGLGYAELTQLPEIRRSIDRFMRRVNGRLERWEQIKRYAILDHELSLADGTLTPNLKVRREPVRQKYEDVIEAMYADESTSDLVSE
ncbi:long-chain fatty acid--CoA ligase [Brooklawnia cerclae]|uniref:Long-chain acyl-CoA synthetase n=1 Tax=Brooklawnia cerclae TaxID=349934 RepID=A0ABX0SJ67_9ACTN|nr:long-chain fatty acid--CoA ligase [Brooklawnia cerclae]NIH57353.1 long-chain acyl-CoA synthetase [Brooklawnia cerclae]